MCSSFCLSLRDRFQAWFVNEMDSAMHATYGSRKRSLFEELPNQIVEIGPGAGANFRYYPRGTRIIAIEPNAKMHARLRQRSARFGLELEILDSAAEQIPLPNDSASLVVGTLVLCTVGDPVRVLSEVRRILRPNGRYVFLEHVVARRGSFVAFQQRCVRRPWPWMFAGCRVDQDTRSLIESNRFDRIDVDEFSVGWNAMPFSPHISGTAFK